MRDNQIPDVVFNAQRWGGAVEAPTPAQGDFVEMVRVSLDRKHAAPWLLVLNSPVRQDGGDVSVETNGPTYFTVFPTVVPAIPAPSGLTTTPAINDALVKLRYGDSAAQSEEVVFDYPVRGAAYEISGSFIEVAVRDRNNGVGQTRARYAGAVNRTDAFRARASGQQWDGPTYSQRFNGLVTPGPSAPVKLVALPRRAVAVRVWMMNEATGAITSPVFEFYDGNGSLLASNQQPGSQTGIPIPPWTQQVGLRPTGVAGTSNQLIVQWLISL